MDYLIFGEQTQARKVSMTFTVFTHVPHIRHENKLYAYRPYVTEMNLWFQYFDTVRVVAPRSQTTISPLDAAYEHAHVTLVEIKSFDFTTFKNICAALLSVPIVFLIICNEFRKQGHFHLRCPGNVGLLACIAQIFFPRKRKTAKYAGNWDTNSKQPRTYKWQRSILNSTFWSRNMQVLVYGEWPDNSKNIVPFFTATYSETEGKTMVEARNQNSIEFIFVGGLTSGKNPFYALDLFERVQKTGLNCTMKFFGTGNLEDELTKAISQRKISNCSVAGGVSKEALKAAYQRAHFMLLPSESEGWPKAVAEAMFWGCIPIVTPVSCVPQMLNDGSRGILLTRNLDEDAHQVIEFLKNESWQETSNQAHSWSVSFTLEAFDNAIYSLINHANTPAN